jgi:hypothetical protein
MKSSFANVAGFEFGAGRPRVFAGGSPSTTANVSSPPARPRGPGGPPFPLELPND